MSKKLTDKEVVRAMTNDPGLSTAEHTLGGRTFKIVDLSYDDYKVFVAHLNPLIEMLLAKLVSFTGLQSEASSVNASGLLKYCCDSMEDLALIVVHQTEPDVTMEELKKLAGSPFKLAGLVMKQIHQNRIIEEIGDFFVQMLPLLPIPQAK